MKNREILLLIYKNQRHSNLLNRKLLSIKNTKNAVPKAVEKTIKAVVKL